MPNYLVELEDGRKFQVEADSPPTSDDLTQYFAAQSAPQAQAAKKDLPFGDITDVASALGQAASSSLTTVPASFRQMYEGSMNPWEKSAESLESRKAMQRVAQESEAAQAEAEASGDASVMGRAIRSGIPSYGFTGAILPVSVAAGGVAGLGTGLVSKNPVAAQRAAMAAGSAASGVAAYRMAASQFMDDARERIDNFFLEKAGRLPNKQEQDEAYQELLPLAQEMGMAEALPEAFGNLALAGAGKYIYRILGGKTGVQQLASGALSKARGLNAAKALGAGAASTGVEVGTEGLTEMLNEDTMKKLEEGVMRGEDVSTVQTEPYSMKRLGESIEKVAEPTLATTAIMGLLGAGGGMAYRAATKQNLTESDFRNKMEKQLQASQIGLADPEATAANKSIYGEKAEEAAAALKALDEGRTSDVEKFFNVRFKPSETIAEEPSMLDPVEVAVDLSDASVQTLAATGNAESAIAKDDFNQAAAEVLPPTEPAVQSEQKVEAPEPEVTPSLPETEMQSVVDQEAPAGTPVQAAPISPENLQSALDEHTSGPKTPEQDWQFAVSMPEGVWIEDGLGGRMRKKSYRIKKSGSEEIEFEHQVFNEETGKWEDNPSAYAFMSKKKDGSLSVNNQFPSPLQPASYTEISTGERKISKPIVVLPSQQPATTQEDAVASAPVSPIITEAPLSEGVEENPVEIHKKRNAVAESLIVRDAEGGVNRAETRKKVKEAAEKAGLTVDEFTDAQAAANIKANEDFFNALNEGDVLEWTDANGRKETGRVEVGLNGKKTVRNTTEGSSAQDYQYTSKSGIFSQVADTLKVIRKNQKSPPTKGAEPTTATEGGSANIQPLTTPPNKRKVEDMKDILDTGKSSGQRDTSKPEQMTPEEYASSARDPELPKSYVLSDGNGNFITEEKNGWFKVWRLTGTHATLAGTVGFKGAEGLAKAKTRLKEVSAEMHEEKLQDGLRTKRPVSKAAVDAYGITLPEGYVRQGDLYVFQPGGPVEAKPAPPAKPSLEERAKAVGYTFRPAQLEGIRKNNRMAMASLDKMLTRMEREKAPASGKTPPARGENRKAPIPEAEPTPAKSQLVQQWEKLKAEAGDALVAVRLGDFYEFFFEDAKITAPILNVALTKRGEMAMTGVPSHAAYNYFQKLINAGRSIAIAEMSEDGKTREIVEIRRPIQAEAKPTLQPKPAAEVETESERERIKAFEQRVTQKPTAKPLDTKNTTTDNKVVVKSTPKLSSRKAKDQIVDIVPAQDSPSYIPESLTKNMFPSQVSGANAVIDALEKTGAALNGDGAGVGKTRQILAVASHYAAQGKPVVIITENAAIGKPWEGAKGKTNPTLGGSMAKDGQAMGIEVKLMPDEGFTKPGIYISTYNRVTDAQIPEGAVLIFDESQGLVNVYDDADPNKELGQWQQKFRTILDKAEKTAFYSATPADKPHQMSYLYKVLGYDSPQDFLVDARKNGLTVKTTKFGKNETKKYDIPFSSVKRTMLFRWVNNLMKKAGLSSSFIKREISYEGTDTQFHDVQGTDASKNPWAEKFNDVVDELESHQRNGWRLLAPDSYLLYAAELTKIGEAVRMVKRELAAGRKAVLYFSRIKEQEIRGRQFLGFDPMDGTPMFSDVTVLGTIPSPVDLLRAELEKEGIGFTELHSKSGDTSATAQKKFAGNTDVLLASVESGGTGINLDDPTGKTPRTEVFMFAPYRGISTVQAMGRIWRASTVQDDSRPNRYVFLVASDIKQDAMRSAILAKKLQLMDASLGGTAVNRLPMSKVSYSPDQLVGMELPEEGVEVERIEADKTKELKPVNIEFKMSQKGNLWANANADLLEWYEAGGPERTGLNITVFQAKEDGKVVPGKWIALSEKQYAPEEFALPAENQETQAAAEVETGVAGVPPIERKKIDATFERILKRKTADQIFKEEEAALERQRKLDERLRQSLNSIIDKEKTNIVQGTVSKADAEFARRTLNNSGEIPNAFLTRVYASPEEFLADKGNQRLFPSSYSRLQSESNIEGLFERGQTLIFADKIGVSDLDRRIGKNLGISPQQAAARRVIAHENGHRGVALFTASEKRELLGYLRRKYNDAQIDNLVRVYSEYADWRTNLESRNEALEELFLKDFERLEKIPTGGIWDDIVEFLKRVWRRLTGRKGDPTLQDMKDVVRLLRNAMRRTAVPSFTTKDGGEVKLSLSDRFRFSRVEYASDYQAAVSAGAQLARDTVYDDRIIEMRDAIRRAYEQSSTEAGVAMPIDELYAKANAITPMSESDFGNILQDLYEDNGAVLQDGATQISGEPLASTQNLEKDNPFNELIRKSSSKSPSIGEINSVSKKFITRFIRPDSSFARQNDIRIDGNATLQARALPDGGIVIGYSLSQDSFDGLQKMAPQAASQYTKDAAIEELIHLSDLIGLRNQWLKSGKQIPFDQFVLNEQSNLAFSLIQQAFDVFTSEGRRAGFAVIMPKRAVASRVETEGPAFDAYRKTVEAINENSLNAFSKARPMKGASPQVHTVKSSKSYEQAAIELVNDLAKDGTPIEDIAESLFSDEFLQGLGIKLDIPALVSLIAEVKNRVSNQSRDDKIPGARRVKLQKLDRKLAGYWQDLGTNSGRSQGIRSYITRNPRYRWMFIFDKAEEQLRKDRELAATRVASDLPQTAENLQKTDAKIAEETDEQVADDVEQFAESEDDTLLREGETALDSGRRSIWERMKDVLRKLALVARARKGRAANAAKASISKEERDAISQMSDAELAKMESDLLSEFDRLSEAFLKGGTEQQKATRKKMVATAKKRAEQGKPIEVTSVNTADVIDGIFVGFNDRDSIINEVGDALLKAAEQRKVKPKQKTAIQDLIAAIRQTLTANLKGEQIKADQPSLGKLLGKTFAQQGSEAALFAKSWEDGRKKVRAMLADMGVDEASLDEELDAIMPPTPTLAYAPAAAKKAINVAIKEAGLTPQDALSNPAFFRESIMAKFNEAAEKDNLTEEGWNQSGKALAEKAINEFIDNARIKAEKRSAESKAKMEKRKVEIADKRASQLIYSVEERFRQGSKDLQTSKSGDSINKAFRDQVKDPVSKFEFFQRLAKLNVSQDVSERLFRTAAREKADLKAMEAFRRLEGPNALQTMLREISALRPGEQAPLSKQIPWRKLLSQKASTVEIYRQRIFDAISSEESLANLDDAQKAKLADLFTQAWESKRKAILDRMVDNAISQEQAAGRLTKEGADALRSQRQKLVEDINLGILDEDRLMKHLADKFGIKSEFTEAERANIDRLLDILQDDKLNEVKRNKAAYELLEALSSATKIPIAKLLADYWVSSVLSGVNTAASIAMAVMSGGYELTTGAFRILRAGFTNPKELPAEIAASFKAIAEFLKAFGREGRLAWQYLVTGDRAFLDPSMNTVLNDLNYDSIGKTVSLAEKMAKSDKLTEKVMGIWMRSVSRLLTALDSFNSGVTKAGALPIVFRQLNLDAESLKQATEKYNLQLYRDRVIERDFDRIKPTTAHDKALVDSYAKAEMMADLQEFGKFSENADFFGQQGAMTLDPTGFGGFFYSSIKSLTGGATNRADKFLAEAEREWKQADGADKTAKGLQLAFAYFLQFGAYNSANLAGLRFARFAGNKFNQGLSFIPGIGMFRMYEATVKDSKIEAKEAFTDMILRNQTAGLLFAIIGGMALKAITDEPDDEKRGWFINGGWANLTPDRKQQKLAAGQKEFTIGIGGKVYNYQNWPISPILAAIGSLSDLIRFSPEQWNEKSVIGRLGSAAASGVFSAGEIPALSGFQTLFGNNLSSKDPNEKRLDRFAKVMAGWGGGFVPRILKDIDFMADPGLRKYETLWEQTASHIPVYRRYSGEEYYDILGKQIERKVRPGSREFMELESAPEYRTLGKLNSRGIWLTPANAEHRMVGKGRNKRKLTQEEADAYSLETGKGYRQMLLRYGSRLEQMPTERARAFLMDKADEVRDRALKKIVR